MTDQRIPLNHAVTVRWAHLGSNQGGRPAACSGVDLLSGRFAGEKVEAHPGNHGHVSARPGRAEGHQTDTAAAA
jgi:hypothetical protein